MIIIIDYGLGNPVSIRNMLKKAGFESVISSNKEDIEKADKFILPGVGSFDFGISNLKSASYFDILQDKVLSQDVPILGICLGAQLLGNKSEEGSLPGLGWIDADVIRFDIQQMNNSHLKIPHMGWTNVKHRKDSRLFYNMFADPRFYFVHSYHLICKNHSDVLLTANYGYEFTAGVERKNIVGVQFHPEKSHKYGFRLYENFVRYY